MAKAKKASAPESSLENVVAVVEELVNHPEARRSYFGEGFKL